MICVVVVVGVQLNFNEVDFCCVCDASKAGRQWSHTEEKKNSKKKRKKVRRMIHATDFFSFKLLRRRRRRRLLFLHTF